MLKSITPSNLFLLVCFLVGIIFTLVYFINNYEIFYKFSAPSKVYTTSYVQSVGGSASGYT